MRKLLQGLGNFMSDHGKRVKQSVVINGNDIVGGNVKNVSIINGVVTIDGVEQNEGGNPKDVWVEVHIHGNVENLGKVTGSVHVAGDVNGDVDAGMDIKIGGDALNGDVQAGMNIECGNVSGDAKAGMNIDCKNIAGKAKAGMDINIG